MINDGQNALDSVPSIVIQLGLIAIIIGIVATILVDVQTEIIQPEDYVSRTDANVTFTGGYASLDGEYCVSVDNICTVTSGYCYQQYPNVSTACGGLGTGTMRTFFNATSGTNTTNLTYYFPVGVNYNLSVLVTTNSTGTYNFSLGDHNVCIVDNNKINLQLISRT
jgi:hypothetical protein